MEYTASDCITQFTRRLRIDVVTQPVISTIDKNYSKRWLLNITITPPPSNKNLPTSIQDSGYALATAKQRQETTYWESFDIFIYALQTHALLTCGDSCGNETERLGERGTASRDPGTGNGPLRRTISSSSDRPSTKTRPSAFQITAK